jgi:hypothetical protein
MNGNPAHKLLSVVAIGCLSAGCLWAAGAPAAGESIELTVEAGQHDRTNTPVCVLVDLPNEVKSVMLTGGEGKQLPGQLTAPGLLNDSAQGKRELHFILPSLAAGKSLTLSATFSEDAPKGATFSWQNTPEEYAELSCAGRPVVRYMCKPPDPKNVEETCKVFHHVYNPDGTQFVTKGPGGQYTHHRGLFFGYCNITYEGGRAANWGCGTNWQAHAGFQAEQVGPVLGRHQVAVDWHGGKTVFAKERREVCVFNVPGGILIEWTTRLATTGGKVTVDGNAPHAGFQFRAAQEVAEKSSGETYFIHPDGQTKPGQARGSAFDLAWDAMSFVLGENRYSVVYLDRPDNPKRAEYNERVYGRFGSYFKYEVEKGKDLVASYRIWLQDGEMTAEKAVALSNDFVTPPEATVNYIAESEVR